MTYIPPIADMEFVLNELAGLGDVASLPGCEEATPDLVSAVIEEAGKLTSEVLAPLNKPGDEQGSRVEDGKVTTPDGWKEAYQAFIEGGWNGLPFDTEHGGQGLPWLVSAAVQEMLHASNMAFGLCPLLTQAAIEAILKHASEPLQKLYLPKLVSGEWTGTMNLTEPQAGSDLAKIRSRAVPEGDHYLITGQKIFITYGEHDMTDNIIHLVLARTPDAPEGVKGISLFIVPRHKVGPDGSILERNDVRCASLEHKLGIRASPTAVMVYGDNGGAEGYLVGEENQGLKYMFTMMNLARHAVGLEGVAIAERAYQQAVSFARERVQGAPIGSKNDKAPIIGHPDVRRMLMTMKSQIEAMRALAYFTASAFDFIARHPDERERARQQQLLEVLIPVVKGWSTELAVELTSLGVQIHGGMGFIEETGAAQHMRDSRITPIYEGTTGIQANDLFGRKLLKDGGEGVRAVLAMMRETDEQLAAGSGENFDRMHVALSDGVDQLAKATDWILQANDPSLPAAASFYYLRLFGTVAGGWQMARAALAAQSKLDTKDGDAEFYEAKLISCLYYMQHSMPQAGALLKIIVEGSNATLELAEAQF